jgi:hypothetical protein
MWAAKQPPESPKNAGGAMARMIIRDIARCKSVVELSDIYNEWGSSFDYIHAAAALVKCCKLPGGGRSSLLNKLCSTWLTQLPLSGLQGCSNVLWTCVRLGPGAVERLWGPTWEAYIQLLQRDSTGEGENSPQSVSNVLWACAKLRKQPSVDDLQLLVQTFLQPEVLASSTPQNLANFVWALGGLCQLPGWQGGVGEQDVQQLLGKQQLQLLAGSDTSQHPSNVLLGLAKSCSAPVVSMVDAHACSRQLLEVAGKLILSGELQQITNALWACGKVGLADTPFIAAVVAAAPRWLPGSKDLNLRQVVTACDALQYKDEPFMQACLQHGLGLLGQQKPSKKQGRTSKPLSPAERDLLAVFCCLSVVRLDMRPLAGSAVELVSRSGVGHRPSTHPINLAKLWVFHSWLLQHQLLDGKGLEGLLTKQQLQQGEKEAAALGMC